MSDIVSYQYYSEHALKRNYEGCIDDALLKAVITEADKYWLLQATLQSSHATGVAFEPLHASQISLLRANTQPAYIRGACVFSRGAAEAQPCFLYTVLTGLQKFLSWSDLITSLNSHLMVDGTHALLRLTPLEQRHAFTGEGLSNVIKSPITTSIFSTLSQHFGESLSHDQYVTHTVMSAVPSMRTSVYEKLKERIHQYSGGSSESSCEQIYRKRELSSEHPLIDWVCEYYLKQQLPADTSFQYLSSSRCDPQGKKSIDEVELDFLKIMGAATFHLEAHFMSDIHRFWHEGQGVFPSLKMCIDSALGERFLNELLEARHTGRLSSLEFKQLYDCANGQRVEHVESALLHIKQNSDAQHELIAWYCFFIGGDKGKLWVMGAQGLIAYDSWRSFQRASASFFADLIPREDFSNPPLPDVSLSRYVTRIDMSLLVPGRSVTVGYTLLQENVFAAAEAQIIKKVLSDIEYLASWLKKSGNYPVSYQSSDYASLMQAVMDDALNIRDLINPQSTLPFEDYRWSSRFTLGETIVESIDGANEQPKIPLKFIRQRIEALGQQVDAQVATLPTLNVLTKRMLCEQWEAQGRLLLDPDTLLVFMPSLEVGVSPARFTLIDALLQHVTGKSVLPADRTQVEFVREASAGQIETPLNEADTRSVHTVLIDVASQFSELLERHLRSFLFTECNAKQMTYLDYMTDLKAELLSAGGYYFYEYDKRLSLRDAGFISLLYTYRVRALRASYYSFVPDVHRVELFVKALNMTAPLDNCFLVSERGGLDSGCAGHAIFWSPARRYEVFDSVGECQSVLTGRLLENIGFTELTANINEIQRVVISDNRTLLEKADTAFFYFSVIEDDYLKALGSSHLEYLVKDALHACNSGINARLSSEAFQGSVDNYKERVCAGFDIPSLLLEVDTQLFKSALPKLLGEATLDEQQEYARILERYRDAVKNDRDYLHGIPHIHEYAAQVLKKQLIEDFPYEYAGLDEAVVTITQASGPAWAGEIASLGSALSSQKKTLSEYALTGFSQLSGRLTFSSPSGKVLPDAFGETYVKGLVRKLDIGTRYRVLLAEQLTLGTDVANERYKLFCAQLVPQALEVAFKDKLAGVLSEKAYRYLELIMTMPDGLAREPLDGVNIILRPLQILSSPGASPDRVRGIYLIGPEATTSGPLVVWIAYSHDYSFKEYLDERSLLADIQTREPLQQLILTRLEPRVRRKYSHGGFKEPHITYLGQDFFSFDVLDTPPPATLSNVPLTGNALLKIYQDNSGILMDMAKSQSVSIAEADWASFKELMSLIVGTATMFLPARLNIPFMIWQAKDTLEAAAIAAGKLHWGEALTEFVTALSLLISFRQPAVQSRNRAGIDRYPQVTSSAEPALFFSSSPTMSAQSAYRASYMKALEPFAERLIALSDLQYNDSTGVYSSSDGGEHYCVVFGQVFSVNQVSGRWRISTGVDDIGPALRRDTLLKRWLIDTQEPLPGGGPIFSRPEITVGAPGFIIEATGMVEIRRLDPVKAVLIQDAHQCAVGYLNASRRSLRHIFEADSISEEHAQWLKDFLGVSELKPSYIKKIDGAIQNIFTRLIKPSMNPLTSNRYVVGRSRSGSNSQVAFITTDDKRKYIYLNQAFFHTGLDKYQPGVMPELKVTEPAFDFNRHFRAVTLIHELSHQVSGTEDIAYLNSTLPYVEFLNDGAYPAVHYASRIKRIQLHALSKSTPRAELFKQQLSTTSQRPDVNERVSAHILKLTGAGSLDQARDFFLEDDEKRVQLILSNADSLALIISRLGGGKEAYRVVELLP